jgi:hypothetical protein
VTDVRSHTIQTKRLRTHYLESGPEAGIESGPEAGIPVVLADGSAWEMGTLGQAGAVPGWPGEEAFPPQPMVEPIAAVLERWSALFFSFLSES